MTNANAKYVSQIMFTDVKPFEIIEVKSEKMMTIREMNAVLDPAWKPEVFPGGFSTNTANNDTQRWTITSNDQNPTKTIRLHKTRDWKCRDGNRFVITEAPYKVYDFNF